MNLPDLLCAHCGSRLKAANKGSDDDGPYAYVQGCESCYRYIHVLPPFDSPAWHQLRQAIKNQTKEKP